MLLLRLPPRHLLSRLLPGVHDPRGVWVHV